MAITDRDFRLSVVNPRLLLRQSKHNKNSRNVHGAGSKRGITYVSESRLL